MPFYPRTPRGRSTKNPMRRLTGVKSRAMGKQFEDLIAAACHYYENIGVALIEKTPEPFQVTKGLESGRFVGHFATKAQPDYKGVMTGGRCVVFEAKHTQADQISQNRVTDAQRWQLDKYHEMGAHCFIVVSLGFVDFYKVPWEVWRDMKSRFQRAHMKHSDLEPYRVACVNGVIRILDLCLE